MGGQEDQRAAGNREEKVQCKGSGERKLTLLAPGKHAVGQDVGCPGGELDLESVDVGDLIDLFELLDVVLGHTDVPIVREKNCLGSQQKPERTSYSLHGKTTWQNKNRARLT